MSARATVSFTARRIVTLLGDAGSFELVMSATQETTDDDRADVARELRSLVCSELSDAVHNAMDSSACTGLTRRGSE